MKSRPFEMITTYPFLVRKDEWIKDINGQLLQITSISKVESFSQNHLKVYGRGKPYQSIEEEPQK